MAVGSFLHKQLLFEREVLQHLLPHAQWEGTDVEATAYFTGVILLRYGPRQERPSAEAAAQTILADGQLARTLRNNTEAIWAAYQSMQESGEMEEILDVLTRLENTRKEIWAYCLSRLGCMESDETERRQAEEDLDALARTRPDIFSMTQSEGGTMLHVAAWYCQSHAVRYLLNRMSREAIDTVDYKGRTACHIIGPLCRIDARALDAMDAVFAGERRVPAEKRMADDGGTQ